MKRILLALLAVAMVPLGVSAWDGTGWDMGGSVNRIFSGLVTAITGSTKITPAATSVLTGSINPTASTTLTGVGTLFLSELVVGDKITVSSETRTVVAIASDTSLTVDTATTDTANDTSVDRYPVGLSIVPVDSSVGTDLFVNPATKSSGNLFDFRVANTSKASLTSAGNLTATQFSGSFVGGQFSTSRALDQVFVATGALTDAANSVFIFSGKPAIHAAGTDLEAFRSAPDLSNNHTGGNWISYSAPNLASADADIVKYGVKIGTGYNYPIIAAPPTAETIAEGATITANACGTLKVITAAGPVTTNTTDSFTAPAAANAGCCMTVYNSGANTITIDTNTTLVVGGAANLAVTQLDTVRFCSDGTNWLQVSALLSLN